MLSWSIHTGTWIPHFEQYPILTHFREQQSNTDSLLCSECEMFPVGSHICILTWSQLEALFEEGGRVWLWSFTRWGLTWGSTPLGTDLRIWRLVTLLILFLLLHRQPGPNTAAAIPSLSCGMISQNFFPKLLLVVVIHHSNSKREYTPPFSLFAE